MALDPWYKIVTLRREVREGRSFSPDEFAIALEQIVAQTAPADYREPAQFFSRPPSGYPSSRAIFPLTIRSASGGHKA